MDNRDRVFLKDFSQATYMNHIATAYILRSRLEPTGKQLEDVAVFIEGQLGTYPSREAVEAAIQQSGDAKSLERIICAKIFSELVATCEDLGALCDAITYRNRRPGQGIFYRYTKCGQGQPADFFDNHVLTKDVHNDPTVTLEDILDLPPLASLAGLPQEVREILEFSYRACAINIYSAAHIYRDPGVSIGALGGDTAVPSDAEDEVRIILDIAPQGQALRQQGGLAVRAHNKIKHRLMLTQHLSEYTDPTADGIEYGRFSPDVIDVLVHNTVSVAGTMIEIVTIVDQLDKASIAV